MQIHGYELMQQSRRPLERPRIAEDWYSHVFLPTLELIDDPRFVTPCASRMPADAFLWLWQQRPALSVEHGPQLLADVARMAIDGRLHGRRRIWPRGR